VILRIAAEIGLCQQEESPGGSQASAMFRMIEMEKLESEVNKASGKLDKSLVKRIVGVESPLTEPELFQDIVSLVVEPSVETGQIPAKAGDLEALTADGPGIRLQRMQELRDALGLRWIFGRM